MNVKSAKTTRSANTIKPLGDLVLIQVLEAHEKPKSGIIIPDTAKDPPQEGRVIAVGPGRVSEEGTRIAPGLRKRDTVLYGKYAGTEFIEHTKYLLLRETHILAVLR